MKSNPASRAFWHDAVSFVVLDDPVAISGAQPAELSDQALAAALEHEAGADTRAERPCPSP